MDSVRGKEGGSEEITKGKGRIDSVTRKGGGRKDSNQRKGRVMQV